MKRMAVLAATLLGLSTAVGQQPSRIFSPARMPTQEELDRLNLKMAWRTLLPSEYRLDGVAIIQHIGNQIIVQLRNGTFLVLNSETGEVEWTHSTPSRYPVMRPVGVGIDHLYHMDGNRITSLNRATGTQHWSLDLPEVPLTPPSSGELLFYVPFPNGRMLTYALPETADRLKKADRATRQKARDYLQELRKEVSKAQPITMTGLDPRSAGGDYRGRSMTAVSSDRRTATGSEAMLGRGEIRQYVQHGGVAPVVPLLVTTQSPGFRVEHPILVSNYGVLISGYDKEVLFLRRDAQRPLFRFSVDGPISYEPVQFGPVAYFVTQGGNMQSVDLMTGLVGWRYATGSRITDRPVVTSDAVFVASDRTGVTRLDPTTGLPTWEQPEAKKFLAVNGKFVYANDRHGKLLVLDRAMGTLLSRADFSSFNVPFANATDNRLILASNDGWIVSMHDRGQTAPQLHAAPPPAPPRPAVEPTNPPAEKTETPTNPPAEKAK